MNEELTFKATVGNLSTLNYEEHIAPEILDGKIIKVDSEGGMYLYDGNTETHVLQESGLLDELEQKELWQDVIKLAKAKSENSKVIWGVM